MLVRSVAVLSAVIACVALGAPHAAAATSYRAHWTLDGAGGTAVDTSGNGNDGVAFNVVGEGDGYRFNGVTSRVIVPSSASLNPGSADFSFGATVTMTAPPPRGETYDVLRKGLVTNRGGDYKLEIMNSKGKAVAHCVVKSFRQNGTKVLASVRKATSLANGRPHRISCSKTSTGITIQVDSLRPNTKRYSGGLGSVSNTADLGLGAKPESKPKSGYDWFKGVMSDAWVA